MQTGPWKCDHCGHLIKDVNDGYIEWLLGHNVPESQPRKEYGLVLIHNINGPGGRGCHYNDTEVYQRDRATIRSLAINGLMDDDGLMKLLSLLQSSQLPAGEVITMIQRLRIPNYEQAMPYMAGAISEGEVEPNMNEGFYFQYQLQAAVDWGKTRQKETVD